MLKNKITNDYLTAFKERDLLKKNLLSTVKGEITTQEKNQVIQDLSDDDVIKILNKFVKGLKENLKLNPEMEQAKKELEILEGYLPKPLTEGEIRMGIAELFSNPANRNIKTVMESFAGSQVDRKLVSQIAKEMLA